ncbi:transposable element gene, partial [Prunus dulcis]
VLLDKENVIGETSAPGVATVPESQEISINYTSTDELWSRNEMIIDDIFAFSVAAEIIKDDDIEPCSINECTQRQDWPKWKDAIQAELNSLEKRSVFGHIVPTPPNVNPVGYKWVFTRKRNEKNEISRYKARLVAQGFSQRPGIDYVETYSPVMDTITFRYLISLAVSEKLEMRLMDKSESGFAIVAVYVDDMNLIGTSEELQRLLIISNIEHSANGILVHQSTYTEKPDISFSVNLLARYSSAPTRRHWTGIKHVLRYLRGTTDMGLFYSSESTNAQSIVGYADAGYLSDPHQGRSQTGNCNLMALNETNISGTSSNHSEILALHEASRECVWLRSVIHHIRSTCALPSATDTPTILNEDNAACIAQITGGYIKGDRTKHISPKFFYTHELQKVKKSKSDKSAQAITWRSLH